MWPNPQETVGLFTFTNKILNGKLHFFCSVNSACLPNGQEKLFGKFAWNGQIIFRLFLQIIFNVTCVLRGKKCLFFGKFCESIEWMLLIFYT